MKQPVVSYAGIIFIGVILTACVQSSWAWKRFWQCSEEELGADATELNFTTAQQPEFCLTLPDILSTNKTLLIKCQPYYIGYNRYPLCSKWCSLFAVCFNEPESWSKRCFRKFQPMLLRFLFAPIHPKMSPSFMKINVKPACRPFWNGHFLISIDTCSCGAGHCKHALGPPNNGNHVKWLENCEWKLVRKELYRCSSWNPLKNEGLRSGRSDISNRLCEALKNCTLKHWQQIQEYATTSQDNYYRKCLGKRELGRVWSDTSLENCAFAGDQFPHGWIFFKSCGHSPGRIENCLCDNTKGSPGKPENLTQSEKTMVQFCTYSSEEIDVEDKDALQNVASRLATVIQELIKNANLRVKKASTTLRNEDEVEIIREAVHFTTTAFEDFAVRFAQEQLSDVNPQSSVTDRVDLKVRRVFSHNKEEFNLTDTEGGNSITIPAENFINNDSVVLGVIYKDLHELFITNRTNKHNMTKKNRELNTIIMSAAIYPPTEVLNKSVTLVFKGIDKSAGNRRECVHWNYSEDNPEGWSGKGCNTTSINSSQTVCVCNHLTHFAVLMYYDGGGGGGGGVDDNDSSVLSILTYVGVVLSLLGAVITIICYLLLTDKHAPLSQIRVSLVASLGAGQITFLAGIDDIDSKGACITAAALMQYFFMAAFCWMLVEGIYLYLFVVKVYNVSNKMTFYHGMAWGIPAILVAISLSIAAGTDGIESFVSDKYCWLSSSNGLIWIFVSFVVLIELVNMAILVRVIKEMASMQHVKDQQSEQIKLCFKTCAVLIPLLGVTWLVGLLAPLHKVSVNYIFVILNSTQGFLIFVLHCARNTEIRARFMRRIGRRGPADKSSTSRVKKISQANQSTVNDVDPRNIFELQ